MKTSAEQIAQGLDAGSPFEIGRRYWIRTVTYHHIGTVKSVHKFGESFICINLTNARFINESGPIKESFDKKECKNWEYEPDITVWLHAITDHSLFE